MNYTCPYCGRHSTITTPDQFSSWEFIRMNKSMLGDVGFGINVIVCPNNECKELSLKGRLTSVVHHQYDNTKDEGNKKHIEWNLLPESEAKILPDYVPEAIKNDYYEACRICFLSPKASATLSRRCLQGMVRDFHGITKSRLKDEIDTLKGVLSEDVWQSIDAVRNVGNIGAHMEKDINLIVDVDPSEAQLLISLLEQLVDDWYVVREQRRKRSLDLQTLAAQKDEQKKSQL